MFKITVGLQRRSEFRDVEDQGINKPFWPFQAERKTLKYNECLKIASIILNFLRDSLFPSFFLYKVNREHTS